MAAVVAEVAVVAVVEVAAVAEVAEVAEVAAVAAVAVVVHRRRRPRWRCIVVDAQPTYQPTNHRKNGGGEGDTCQDLKKRRFHRLRCDLFRPRYFFFHDGAKRCDAAATARGQHACTCISCPARARSRTCACERVLTT